MAESPFDVTIQVAEVTDAEAFPEAEKPQLVTSAKARGFRWLSVRSDRRGEHGAKR